MSLPTMLASFCRRALSICTRRSSASRTRYVHRRISLVDNAPLSLLVTAPPPSIHKLSLRPPPFVQSIKEINATQAAYEARK